MEKQTNGRIIPVTIIGFILAILVPISFVLIYKYINSVKEFGIILGGYATVVLAVVTFFYARSTKNMADVMAKQITADIHITDVKLHSSFLNRDLMKRIADSPSSLKTSYFDFQLTFFARNSGAGSGSIDKPTLIIRFPNNINLPIDPVTKEIEHNIPDTSHGHMEISTDIEHDLGATVFLEGGESSRVELEYDLDTENLLDTEREAIILTNYKEVKYYIVYRDNLSNEHSEEIEHLYFDADY
jgi:hypothetical protein